MNAPTTSAPAASAQATDGKNHATATAIATGTELSASERWCHAFDSSAGDFTRRATFRVQRKISSFSTIETAAIAAAAIPGGATCLPSHRLPAACAPSSHATTASARAMNTVTSASIFPCPYGCSASAGATQ